jgi:hypothetical protein
MNQPTLLTPPQTIKARLATVDPTTIGVNIDRRAQIIPATDPMSATDFISAAFWTFEIVDVCEWVDEYCHRTERGRCLQYF